MFGHRAQKPVSRSVQSKDAPDRGTGLLLVQMHFTLHGEFSVEAEGSL
jgi:hypothetical protein